MNKKLDLEYTRSDIYIYQNFKVERNLLWKNDMTNYQNKFIR